MDKIYHSDNRITDDLKGIIPSQVIQFPNTTGSQYAPVLVIEPEFVLSEQDSFLDINKAELAVGRLRLSRIMLFYGTISLIDVYVKKSTENDYTFIQTYPVEVLDDDLILVFNFPLQKKGEEYDFKFVLKGTDGIVGMYANGAESIVLVKNKVFDGVTELTEIHEVYYLKALNAEEGELIKSDTIRLTWTDFRKLNEEEFETSGLAVINGYDGTVSRLTYIMSRKIVDYVVYMFVNDTDDPPFRKYPAENLKYHRVAITSDNIIDIKLPYQKYVAFWVGFRMRGTIKNSVFPKKLFDVETLTDKLIEEYSI